jgi:hypothetical protein
MLASEARALADELRPASRSPVSPSRAQPVAPGEAFWPVFVEGVERVARDRHERSGADLPATVIACAAPTYAAGRDSCFLPSTLRRSGVTAPTPRAMCPMFASAC